jgi:hypothetical protein
MEQFFLGLEFQSISSFFSCCSLVISAIFKSISMLNILILYLKFYQLNSNGYSLFFLIFYLSLNFQMISLLHLVSTKVFHLDLVVQIYFEIIGCIFSLDDKPGWIIELCFEAGFHLNFLERSLDISQKLNSPIIFLRLETLDFLVRQYHH